MVRVRSYGEGGLLLHVVVLLIFLPQIMFFSSKNNPVAIYAINDITAVVKNYSRRSIYHICTLLQIHQNPPKPENGRSSGVSGRFE